MNKQQKILTIIGITFDIIFTLGLLVMSIILFIYISVHTNAELQRSPDIVKFFVEDNSRIIMALMIPLFVLFIFNTILVFLYVRRLAKRIEKNQQKILNAVIEDHLNIDTEVDK